MNTIKISIENHFLLGLLTMELFGIGDMKSTNTLLTMFKTNFSNIICLNEKPTVLRFVNCDCF